MMKNDCVKEYAKKFSYNKLEHTDSVKKETYIKRVKKAFIVIESLIESKYVNFYFNEKVKTFKKTDLILSILENTPAGWDEENDSNWSWICN